MSEHTVRVPSTSGIYKLSCIPNKRIYIGSAINLQSRKRQHFHELRRNRHCNRHLQRAWNKYGEAAFSFEVLEIVLPISLTAREQYWINLLKPFGRKGFNIAHEAGSHLGIKYSPATKEKMSIQRRGKKQTPEFIEKRVAPLRGRKYKTGRKHTAEHRAKIGQAQLGRKMSPDAVEKSRQAKLGKKMSPEARENMRQAQLGKKQSSETREKIRQARLGKKRLPETIEKIRQSWQRRKEAI